MDAEPRKRHVAKHDRLSGECASYVEEQMKTLVLRSGLKVLGSQGFEASRRGLAPFLILRRSRLFAVLLGLALLSGCGGGSGGILPPPSGNNGGPGGGGNGGSADSTAVLVSVGGFTAFRDDNAPSPIADQIVSFELTIESVALRSSKGDVSIFSTPRTFELSRLSSKAEPLLLGNVAQGNYTGIVIGVSNPRLSFIDSSGVLHENVAASLTSSTATDSREFTIDSIPRAINLVPLARVGGSSVVTVTPLLNFSTQGPFSVKELLGRVTTVESAPSTGRPNFTIDAGNNSTFTFGWDWWDFVTDFQGFDGELTAGMTVEVSAEGSEGTRYFYARKVKLEHDDARAVVVEGPALSLSLAQLQMLVRQAHGPGGVTLPAVGKALIINANAPTQFRLDSDSIDLNNLDFTPTFDALTIAPGQNVRAAAASGSATTVSADRLELQEQSFDGIAGAVTAGVVSDQFSVPLTLAADSAFAQLTGHNSVIVTLQPSTQKFLYLGLENCVTCIAGGAVRVRGLLFFSGGQYRLVAEWLSVG